MTVLHIINNLEVGGAERQLIHLVCNDSKNKHIIFNLIGKNLFEEKLKESNVIEII